ncbi:MAG: hypothetical protein FJ137_04985 [Deltaproteobacteria bacterium]|nr:hypothetical protein [Deltaproteobacteria bacterium]
MSAAVLLVSCRPSLLAPLVDACAAGGLDVDVADDAAAAAAAARGRGSRDDPFVGVVVDVDAVADLAEPLCEELRLIPGFGDAPIVFVGPAASPLSSTAAVVAVGGDAFFALPVEAWRVVGKVLAYGGAPPAALSAVSSVLPEEDPAPARSTPSFAHAATPDELLAALGDAAVVAPTDDDELLAAGAGTLTPGLAPALLWAAHAGARAGTLELLDDAGVRRAAVFVDGAPLTLRSTAPAEQAEAVLLRLGWSTSARLASARAARALPSSSTTTAEALSAALVQAGALLPEERAPVTAAILAEQLAAFVAVDTGAWQLRSADGDDAGAGRGATDGHADDGDARALASRLAEAVRRRFDEPRLLAAAGGGDSVWTPRVSVGLGDEPLPAWRAALRDDEGRALRCCDGTRTLEAVVDVAGVPPAVAATAVLLGWIFGALQPEHRGPAPGEEARRDRLAQARTLERERVLDRLRRAREGDWFHLLSLTADASAHEVAASARALRARFDPARAVARGVGDLRGALREIVAALDEAEAVLLDDELRAAHRRRTVG